MFSKVQSSIVKRKFILAAPAVLWCLLLGGAAAAQPTELGKTVYGTPKKAPSSNAVAPKRKNPPPRKPARTVVKNTAVPSKTFSANNYLNVTFVGKEPAVEVWLNSKNIGLTDGKSQLTKKLAPGKYKLMAKNKRQVFLLTREIVVGPEQTSFNLYTEPPPNPIVADVDAPKTEQKSAEQLIIETSNKVKTILENYANPATTDQVSLDDWQFVFQAAQFGELQGYTAVQIEAQRWFASGQIELANKEYTNALTAFTKAQEFMPSSALPFYALGNTYFANKQYGEAHKLYLKTLQLDPKLAMAYKKLADTERLLNREKEAISAYRHAIRFGYSTAETRFWLGALMLDGKQTEEALKILEDVAKEMPKAEVFIRIGGGYEKLKRDVSAIEFYQKAIEVDEGSALAYYKLANVYVEQREHTKAKEALEKAIALDPKGEHLNRTEAQKKLREVSSKINK